MTIRTTTQKTIKEIKNLNGDLIAEGNYCRHAVFCFSEYGPFVIVILSRLYIPARMHIRDQYPFFETLMYEGERDYNVSKLFNNAKSNIRIAKEIFSILESNPFE